MTIIPRKFLVERMILKGVQHELLQLDEVLRDEDFTVISKLRPAWIFLMKANFLSCPH